MPENKYPPSAQPTYQKVLSHLHKNLIILVVVMAFGGIAGFLFSRYKTVKYEAIFTLVKSNMGGPGISIGLRPTISMQFNPLPELSTPDVISDFMKSRRVLEHALNAPAGNNDTTLLERIAKSEYGWNVRALINRKNLNLDERDTINRLIDFVRQSFTFTKPVPNLVYYRLVLKGADNQISYYLGKEIINKTADEYYRLRTKNINSALTILNKERDSISSLMALHSGKLNAAIDRSFRSNPSQTVQAAGTELSMVQMQALMRVYVDVTNNLEIVRLMAGKAPELFEILDEPDLPLSAEPRPWILVTIAGMLTTLAVTVLTLSARVFLNKCHEV